MTPTQAQQWNESACMSEALIAAAKIKQIPLSPDDYRARYEAKFPFPTKHYGGLFLSVFWEIAQSIGLGTRMDLIWHFDKIEERFNHGHLVFVFSGLHLHPRRCDPFSHVSVLEKINNQNFSVVGFPISIPASDWVSKRCCGIVIF